MTATGGVDAAGGALCPIPPRFTDDSRVEDAGGARNRKLATEVHRVGRRRGTHERQAPAEQQQAVAATEWLLAARLREEH